MGIQFDSWLRQLPWLEVTYQARDAIFCNFYFKCYIVDITNTHTVTHTHTHTHNCSHSYYEMWSSVILVLMREAFLTLDLTNDHKQWGQGEVRGRHQVLLWHYEMLMLI